MTSLPMSSAHEFESQPGVERRRSIAIPSTDAPFGSRSGTERRRSISVSSPADTWSGIALAVSTPPSPTYPLPLTPHARTYMSAPQPNSLKTAASKSASPSTTALTASTSVFNKSTLSPTNQPPNPSAAPPAPISTVSATSTVGNSSVPASQPAWLASAPISLSSCGASSISSPWFLMCARR